ncbi:phosphopantetheine-binding protein [Belliella sp. R4-6]|uniref:Phosphopantetheine-binding protein n=1 Tax=Belliella alkalica TaxID=1730871 RepID=A0ABS9V6L0_9BACT|nr:phosphopantetheine-binding protein [Belliella alkalica]MCH7412055.1 phosphopantetheine-binding protein [Belliella alkalica]
MELKFKEVIIEALEIEDREILMSDKFKEFEEWDSLAQLTLIAELDDQFGVTIQSEDFKKIQTLQELFDHIQKVQ